MDKLNQFKETVLEDGYGIVGKKVMRDKKLHVIAKALYSYLCTYGNGGYPSRDLITGDLGITKDTYSKYLKELKENGYIKIEQVKDKGKFKHNVYYIEQIPCRMASDTVLSDTKASDTVKQDTNSTSSNSTVLNTTINNTLAQFEEFWNRYPKKQKKLDAVKAWNKLKPNDELVNLIMIALGKHRRCDGWTKDKGQFIPLPASWLNGERWTDEMSQSEERRELPEH